MTFLELAEKVLREAKRRLSANEIWFLASEKGYVNDLNSKGNTPWASLGAQIHGNSKDNPKSPFAQSGSRPIRFYLKSQASMIDFSTVDV